MIFRIAFIRSRPHTLLINEGDETMTNATHIGRSNIGTVANKLVALVERTEGRNAIARVSWVNHRGHAGIRVRWPVSGALTPADEARGAEPKRESVRDANEGTRHGAQATGATTTHGREPTH
jgi:hypothetical protein